VIYLDTSVVLAQLLAEDRVPPVELWREPLITSRLLEHEVWTQLNNRDLTQSHAQVVQELLGRLAFVELSPLVLRRAVGPFPVPVRTLDAMHLASLLFLVERGQKVQLASYDKRMLAAAAKLQIECFEV